METETESSTEMDTSSQSDSDYVDSDDELNETEQNVINEVNINNQIIKFFATFQNIIPPPRIPSEQIIFDNFRGENYPRREIRLTGNLNYDMSSDEYSEDELDSEVQI